MALIMPGRTPTGTLWDRRGGFAKVPLGLRGGRSVLYLVRHLAQFAGDAEIEA